MCTEEGYKTNKANWKQHSTTKEKIEQQKKKENAEKGEVTDSGEEDGEQDRNAEHIHELVVGQVVVGQARQHRHHCQQKV